MPTGDWFFDYQSFIVGLIGFGGVIIALFVTAWLNRRERRAVFEGERAATRSALAEELKIIKGAVEDTIEKLGDMEGQDGALLPTDPMSHVYREFMPRFGFLTSDEIAKVMFAYLSYEQALRNLILLPGATRLDEHRVQVPREACDAVRELYASVLESIDAGIEALS